MNLDFLLALLNFNFTLYGNTETKRFKQGTRGLNVEQKIH